MKTQNQVVVNSESERKLNKQRSILEDIKNWLEIRTIAEKRIEQLLDQLRPESKSFDGL